MRRAVQLRNASHINSAMLEPINDSASVEATFHLDLYVSIPHLDLNARAFHGEVRSSRPWNEMIRRTCLGDYSSSSPKRKALFRGFVTCQPGLPIRSLRVESTSQTLRALQAI